MSNNDALRKAAERITKAVPMGNMSTRQQQSEYLTKAMGDQLEFKYLATPQAVVSLLDEIEQLRAALAASKPELDQRVNTLAQIEENAHWDTAQAVKTITAASKPEPVGINGLTEAETAASCSLGKWKCDCGTPNVCCDYYIEPQAQANTEQSERAELIERRTYFETWCKTIGLPLDTIPNSTGDGGPLYLDNRVRMAWAWETSSTRSVMQKRKAAALLAADARTPEQEVHYLSGKIDGKIEAHYTEQTLAADKAGGEVVAWRVRRHDSPKYWIIFQHEPVDALQDPEREVQPLYTHPQPQPSALPDVVKDVVKDAERYRFLRDIYFGGRSAFALLGPTSTPQQMDAAIDAAMPKEGK